MRTYVYIHVYIYTYIHTRESLYVSWDEPPLHSPSGPISQLSSPFPVASAVDVANASPPEGGTRSENYFFPIPVGGRGGTRSSDTHPGISARSRSLLLLRQTGPRGAAPGRGPYALLHGTHSLITARRRRHLRAESTFAHNRPRYDTRLARQAGRPG